MLWYEILVFVVVGILVVAILAVLAHEIWVVTKKRNKEVPGVRKYHVIRFADPKATDLSHQIIHKALGLVQHHVPLRGARINMFFLRSKLLSLRDNNALRFLVNGLNIRMRNDIQVSSRNLYIASVYYYVRCPISGLILSGDSDELPIDLNYCTALACFSLHDQMCVRFAIGDQIKEEVVEAGQKDIVLLNLNRRSISKAYIGVRNDVMVIKFAPATSLV